MTAPAFQMRILANYYDGASGWMKASADMAWDCP